MATAYASMGFTPFGPQCGDSENLETYIDFSGLQQSPNPSIVPTSSSPSATTSPTTTALLLDPNEDQQTPAKPSHQYDLFKQQTGLPPGSVPGLYHSNSSSSQGYAPFAGYGTGLDESSLMGGFDGMGSNTGLGMDMDMTSPNSAMPAFFFPPGDGSQASQSDDFIDPSAISSQEEPPPPTIRFFPGMHQQQAALAKAQAQAQAQAEQQRRQQMLQQQQQLKQQAVQQQQAAQQQARNQPSRRSASHQPLDARTEETIARVVNQIRQASTSSSNRDVSPSGVLPHIVRMKKDEEEMDEDERLLASEEGKKLSSKERRQLRNKVSARAFRSRRKEYISQLEGEIGLKTDECNELRAQNQALMDENARSRAFIEKILRHPAFLPFLDDLSRDESLLKPQAPQAGPASTPAPTRKDLNTFALAQQQQQQLQVPQPSHHQNSQQVGMTLIPETPLDLSLLNLGNTWTMTNPMPFAYQQPRVFAVTELPEGPAAPLDVAGLCSKYADEAEDEDVVEVNEEVKHDYPTVEAAPLEVVKESTEAEEDEDDGDPRFALYVKSKGPTAATPASPASPSETESAVISSCKPAQFELVTSKEHDDEESLMERLERMCATIEPVFDRLRRLTPRSDA